MTVTRSVTFYRYRDGHFHPYWSNKPAPWKDGFAHLFFQMNRNADLVLRKLFDEFRRSRSA